MARSESAETTRRGASPSRRRLVIALGVLCLVIAFVCIFLVVDVRGHRDAAARQKIVNGAHFVKTIDASTFQKGNLHTHSDESDGDSPPEDVYLWYRNHGYNFIALTDHNTLDDPKLYARLETDTFRIIAGEEITMRGGGRQVHVNGLCIDKVIDGGSFDTARLALDYAVDAVDAQGGVALINHPNFDSGLTADDVAGTHGAALLEVWSGHPYVWTLGRNGRPSHEQIWETALSRGLDIAPAGVDDTHHLKPPTNDRKPALPGIAWVQVFTDRADSKAICDRLRQGDLYASNGAELNRLSVGDKTIRVWPRDPSSKVELIGQDGAILQTTTAGPDEPATYTLTGTETYVRARVTDALGKLAFTPAYRVEHGP